MRRFVGQAGGLVWAELIADVGVTGDIVTTDGGRYQHTANWNAMQQPGAGKFLVMHADTGMQVVRGPTRFNSEYREVVDTPPGANQPMPAWASEREKMRSQMAADAAQP